MYGSSAVPAAARAAAQYRMVPAGVFFIAIAIPFPSSAASMMTGAGRAMDHARFVENTAGSGRASLKVSVCWYD
ncbi:hypothetical protein GCM10017744_101590 [Streptomyces antimycoticus]